MTHDLSLTLRSFIPTLLCASALACGSPDPASDGGADDGGSETTSDAAVPSDGGANDAHAADAETVPLDLEALPARLAEVACEGFRRCDESVALVDARCANLEGWIREGLVSAIEEAIEDGHVEVNGAGLEACLASLERERFCEVLDSSPGRWIGGCRDVFTGTLGAGAACGFDWECEPALRCRVEAGECGGSCAPRLARGESAGRAHALGAPTRAPP